MLITRKASVIAAAATSRDTIIHKSNIPLLACVQMPKVADGEGISSAANSPENFIDACRGRRLCATNSHLFKVALIIIDLLFSERVTTPLSFSAIRLIALRTRRAGCIPGRAAGALVHERKY